MRRERQTHLSTRNTLPFLARVPLREGDRQKRQQRMASLIISRLVRGCRHSGVVLRAAPTALASSSSSSFIELHAQEEKKWGSKGYWAPSLPPPQTSCHSNARARPTQKTLAHANTTVSSTSFARRHYFPGHPQIRNPEGQDMAQILSLIHI